MCDAMGLSRSCYYQWLQGSGCNRITKDKELTEMIRKIFQEARSTVLGGSERSWLKVALLYLAAGLAD